MLPCAIDRDTRLLAALRDDGRVCAVSREFGEGEAFDTAKLARRGSWSDYLQSLYYAFQEQGVEPPGLDVWVASDVPQESGLSSSAALGVGFAALLARACGLDWSPLELAQLAHRSESEFMGVGCGVMDQFASALGRREHALRIDCRSLETSWIPLPSQDLRLWIAHSGVRRQLADPESGYLLRRRECEQALTEIAAHNPKVRSLRELVLSDLPELEAVLAPSLFRRVRHVVSENARVASFCHALEASDFSAAGNLLRDGMRSLQGDFEASCPELDALCEIGDAQPGVFGSRLTGAGFGGCTLHLVAASESASLGRALAAGFKERFGREPAVFEVTTADGVEAWELSD